MATYLLKWNPEYWEWKDLKECIYKIETEGIFRGRWSCGRTKKIHPGDRIFLMKTGENPRGIVASGFASSKVHEDEHWDVEKSAKGEKAYYVYIDFDTILDYNKKIFSRSRLNNDIYKKMRWDHRASGITIPDDVAEQLEKDWAKFLNQPIAVRKLLYPEESDIKETYTEGAKKRITVNAYERSDKGRAICIKHLGLNCIICGFNFETAYGEIGKGFIHVHHLKPLSEIGKDYELDPLRDLRPICPNCHAMIHQRDPAYEIEELKEILNIRKKSD